MSRNAANRLAYRSVSSSDVYDNNNDDNHREEELRHSLEQPEVQMTPTRRAPTTTTTTTTLSPPAPSLAARVRRPRSTRPYSRVAATEDTASSDDTETEPEFDASESSEPKSDEEGGSFTVTVLDFTQKKFDVSVSASWTVARFKAVSAQVHKVPIALQRLIFQGKMLQDTKTLQESGIIEPGTIIHLFPKPRVVISSNVDNNDQTTNSTLPNNNEGDNAEDNGARVPTIFLDANEAEQRTQILVLGSAEYVEAQNNVKLFSFMLLVISSIDLLNLLALALGVPQDQEGGEYPSPEGFGTDDIFPTPNDDDLAAYSNLTFNQTMTAAATALSLQQWGWINTMDLLISMAGVYVAIMGIQASTDNTLRKARTYLMGTFLVGVAWLIFNYIISVQMDDEVEEDHRENHPDDDMIPDLSEKDIYMQALSVMVLPAMVWIMCCLRAAQFHHLLREAEEEAETRIRSELARGRDDTEHEDDTTDGTSDEERAEHTPPSSTTRDVNTVRVATVVS